MTNARREGLVKRGWMEGEGIHIVLGESHGRSLGNLASPPRRRDLGTSRRIGGSRGGVVGWGQ